MAALLAAVVALLLVGSSFRAEPARASCGSARACVSAATTATNAADPCLEAPSCGGGGVHAGQFAPALEPAGAAVLLAGLSLLASLRRSRDRAPFAGRLTDGGLFRPPRPAV